MKKGICILLSSALLMGTVPVYGDMAEVEQVTHTYRAGSWHEEFLRRRCFADFGYGNLSERWLCDAASADVLYGSG